MIWMIANLQGGLLYELANIFDPNPSYIGRGEALEWRVHRPGMESWAHYSID